MLHDIAIIGGSYAGISAGLQLARARRRVLVLDAGVRRNRFAAASHGFLGQDGRDPAAIAAAARAELLAYPTVTWVDALATSARAVDDGFEIVAGATYRARRVILAVGVADELPPIPGLAERWGTRVFHCPYCHGYELGGAPAAVLATSPHATHVAAMLPDWGPTTYLTNGEHEPDPDALALLTRRGVAIERAPVRAVTGAADIVLADDRTLSFAGIFVAPRSRPASPLAAELGCAHDDGPMGPYIRTDDLKETSVPGVFACGDAALPAGSVAFAVGDGARAGIAAHRSLVFR